MSETPRSDDSEMIKIDVIYGSIQLVQTSEVRGSKIYMGGYAIHRDRYGKEVRRTPNQWNGVMECHTNEEARRLSALTPASSPADTA